MPPKASFRGLITDVAYGRLRALHEQGLSVASIARDLKVSWKTVQRWLSRGVSPSEYAKQHPRPQLSAKRKARIQKRLAHLEKVAYATHTVTRLRVTPVRKLRRTHTQVERKHKSITEMAAAVSRATRVRTSRTQTRRDLDALGFLPWRTPRGPRLKDDQRKVRYDFARRMLNRHRKEFPHIVFSDEKYFDTHGKRHHTIWAKRSDMMYEVRSAGYVQGGPKVMVLGFLSRKAAKLIVCDEESMTADQYQKYLQPVVPMLKAPAWFQQDNASPHNATTRSGFFQRRGVRTMLWPAHSPDLNVIETVWAWLGSRVAARSPLDRAEIIRCVREEGAKMSTEGAASLRALHEEFEVRLRVCVESEGHIVTNQKVAEWKRRNKKA